MRFYPKTHVYSQAGVTLFLSILVLSAITAIAFSVAAVTFVEVATSGDVQRTEPSYYSDQGITEEAIYSLKRRVNGPDGVPTPVPAPPSPLYFGLKTVPCAPDFVQYTSPSPSIQSFTKLCGIATQYNIEVRILPSASSYGNARRFYLYDPTNYGIGGGGYGSVSIVNVSPNTNVTVRAYLCRLDEECNAGSPSVDIPANSSHEFPGLQGDTFSYELAIMNLSISQTGAAQDAYVKIQTYDTNGIGKGLPYLNKEAVEIQSTRSGITRRVQVLVPTQ